MGAFGLNIGGSVQARKIDLKRRALARLAVDFDMAPRLLDETIDLAQPPGQYRVRYLWRVKKGSKVRLATSSLIP